MHWIYAHLLGDWILQNHWMAVNKKKSSLACTAHIAAYMAPFLFCGATWWQLVLVAAQHWLQDRTNFIVWLMRFKGSGEFTKAPFAPWSIIVTDNTVHILWMAAVFSV